MTAEPGFEKRAADVAEAVKPVRIGLARFKLLADALEALESAGIRYCLLRGPAPGAQRGRHREIDLLADAQDLGRLRSAVSGLGFVPLAAWGYGGHHFYVAYDESSGEWLKLDVVTRLGFGGRSGPLVSRAVDRCLDRCQRSSGIMVPDLADAILGLILHCLLDKRDFREEHRRELERLVALIGVDASVSATATKRFETALGVALSWAQANATIGRGGWEWLLAQRRRIAWELFRRDLFGSTYRWLQGELMRFARPVLMACLRRGLTVALVGATEADRMALAGALAADIQLRIRIFYMGVNSQARVADAKQFVFQAYRSLVAFAWGLRGQIVVFDNHPCGRRPTEQPAKGWGATPWRKLLQMTCVNPNLIFVLDAPPEIEFARSQPLQFADQNTIAMDGASDVHVTIRRMTFLIWSRYHQCIAKSR